MKLKALITASAVAAFMAGSAAATTLSGLFDVTAVNVTGLNSSEAEATKANFDAAVAGTLGGGGSTVYTSDVFTYNGSLDFRVGPPQTASYTVGQWLGTGTGTVSDLNAMLSGLQLSSPNINDGSATTTFFYFTLTTPMSVPSFDVTHDDGFQIYEDGVLVGGVNGPTGETNTFVTGFDSGEFSLLYVATNGNPSILEVTPVPLPAAGWMLLAGVGGLVAMKRRRQKA